MKLRISRHLRLLAVPYIFFASCIERDNPWDPVNRCHPESETPVIRQRYEQVVNSGLAALFTLSLKRVAYGRSFDSTRENNFSLSVENGLHRSRIEEILSENDSIEIANAAQTECSRREPKRKIHDSLMLRNLAFAASETAIRTRDSAVLYGKAIEDSLAYSLSLCPKNPPFTQSFVDSTSDSCRSELLRWEALVEQMRNYNGTFIQDTNELIRNFNRMVDSVNQDADRYNEELEYCKSSKLSDPDMIMEAVRNLEPGSTLTLDTGTIRLSQLLIKAKGARGRPIVITGDPAGKTMIESSVYIDSCTELHFTNIVFKNNGETGMQLRGNPGPVRLVRCVFRDARVYGLQTMGGNIVHIEECEFIENGRVHDSNGDDQAGLRLEGGGETNITNILVAGNQGYGIDVISTNVKIWRSTIADNALDGIRYQGNQSEGGVSLTTTIIAGNGGYGLFRQPTQTSRDIYLDQSVTVCLSGNQDGPLGGSSSMIDDNRHLYVTFAPYFPNRDRGDYNLGEEIILSGKTIGYRYP